MERDWCLQVASSSLAENSFKVGLIALRKCLSISIDIKATRLLAQIQSVIQLPKYRCLVPFKKPPG